MRNVTRTRTVLHAVKTRQNATRAEMDTVSMSARANALCASRAIVLLAVLTSKGVRRASQVSDCV